MSEVQIIEKDGEPVFYVVPAQLWDKVRGALEEAQDAAAFDRAASQDDGVRIPAQVAFAVADGMHPVRAWRQHHGWNQERLAACTGLSKPFISQIERGKRAGTAATLKKIAVALGVPLDALT